MDVILLHAVEKLGDEGAVVQVKPGFARNFLLPRGLAVVASDEQRRAIETRQRQRQQQSQRMQAEAETLKRKLEAHSLTLKLTLGENDKPFGSVTSHEIAEALARDGFPVEKHMVHLEEPLKALGIYEVPVRLHASVTATLKLWIVKA